MKEKAEEWQGRGKGEGGRSGEVKEGCKENGSRHIFSASQVLLNLKQIMSFLSSPPSGVQSSLPPPLLPCHSLQRNRQSMSRISTSSDEEREKARCDVILAVLVCKFVPLICSLILVSVWFEAD